MKKFLPMLTAFAVSLVATFQAKAFMFLYRTGGIVCDTDPTVPALVTEGLQRISGQVKEIGTKALTRVSELDIEVGGIKQQLLDLQQEYDKFRDAPGSTPIGSRVARKMLSEAAEELIDGMKGSTSARTTLEFGAKSLSSTAPGAGGTEQMVVQRQDLGLVTTYHGLLTRLIDLLPSEPVTGNAVQYTRITYADGSPAGNAAAKAPELSLKQESEVMTDLITVDCPTWAHYVNVSRQVLADVPLLRSAIDNLLTRGLLDKVDAGVMTDLADTDNHTVYTPTGGDTIGDAVARIASKLAQAGAQNIVVVLNSANFLSMQLTKAEDSGTYLGLPPNVSATIAQCASVPAGKILAFAPGSGAAYADRAGATVEANYVNDGFIRNRATLLSELRGMVIVRDPAHVAYGNLPA